MKPSKKAIAFGEDLGIDTSNLSAKQLGNAIDHDLVERVEFTPGTLTLSNKDITRIRDVRSNAEGAAKTRELLEAASIRPGCIVELITGSAHDTLRVFMGLSAPYEGWIGRRSNTRKEAKCIVAWDKRTGLVGDLKIALVLPPIAGYIHSTFATFKIRNSVDQYLASGGGWSSQQAKDSTSFASRIGSDNILQHEHGNYWNEAAFNKLLEELYQTPAE